MIERTGKYDVKCDSCGCYSRGYTNPDAATKNVIANGWVNYYDLFFCHTCIEIYREIEKIRSAGDFILKVGSDPESHKTEEVDK